MKTNLKTKSNLYAQVTEQIVKQLENGIVPWQKPWTCNGILGCISHTNGKPYSLLNQWLLENRAGEWLTYKQIQAEGGCVKAGEKAHIVVFWKYLDKIEKVMDENGNEVEEIVGRIPYLKSYPVFHIDQTEGIVAKYEVKQDENQNEPIESAEKVAGEYISREGLKFESVQSDRAFYRPSTDSVTIPMIAQFKVVEEYYSTLFHELTHSTGHAKRLNRDGVAKVNFFGDEGYSKEELVAEIGAAFICQTLGLDCTKAFDNSVAYIQSWLKVLKNDTKMIVAAAAKAEQAVKFILTGKRPSE